MSRLENKIEAKNRSIVEVLDKKKYTVDYYQREYSWQQKHIEQLVTDLSTAFLNEYEPQHERTEVENYNSYYLGPFVLSEKEGMRSIIDGQQRLTSLTLILVYLNNLQKSYGPRAAMEPASPSRNNQVPPCPRRTGSHQPGPGQNPGRATATSATQNGATKAHEFGKQCRAWCAQRKSAYQVITTI